MRFALQPRASFRRRNVKKWSEPGVFFALWLAYVLLATAPCNFSTYQLQKVVREWRVLYMLTCQCPSHHSGVQFFDIPTSKSGPKIAVPLYILTCTCASRRATATSYFLTYQLQKVVRTRQFFSILIWKCFLLWRHDSAPAALANLLFDPPDPPTIGKRQRFATFRTFRPTVSFFYWLYFLLTLLSSDSASLVCCSSFHIVGS